MYFFDQTYNKTFTAISVEHAYIAILNDDLTTANAVFEAIDSPRARWGRALTGILAGYMEHYPTYFEIRNFYEIDLDFLVKNEKIDYIENLLGSLEHLFKINQEVYKYTARVMYENKFYNAAIDNMLKSKDLFYKDPELHFMLAKYYYDICDYTLSDFYLSECLNIVPSYYPAIKMKKLTASLL